MYSARTAGARFALLFLLRYYFLLLRISAHDSAMPKKYLLSRILLASYSPRCLYRSL